MPLSPIIKPLVNLTLVFRLLLPDVDRLVHNSELFNMTDESYRLKHRNTILEAPKPLVCGRKGERLPPLLST
jgi:hypothetical protein